MITKSITLRSDSHTISIAVYDDGFVSIIIGEIDMEFPMYVSVDKEEAKLFFEKAIKLLGDNNA